MYQQFFADQLGQNTLFVKSHSYLHSPLIWISPWLDWKAIYFETLYRVFLSAKYENIKTVFYANYVNKSCSPSFYSGSRITTKALIFIE